MIRIAGLQKMTLMDYPGKVAAAVFLGGCNFRCGFCHNPEIVENKPDLAVISEQDFFDFLKSRQGLLEGVCVSGGEPLVNPDLPEFLKKIKALGFSVKLDTNGLESAKLKALIDQGLIDYIAMDIKGSADNYSRIVNKDIIFNNIEKSIKLILDGKIDYEFRTTVMPRFHNEGEIEKIGQMIQGAKKYYLQNFRNHKTLDPLFRNDNCFTESQLKAFKEIAGKYVEICEIRN